MGRVWRAHHNALKRDDALKVVPDAFAADPERVARFQREAQILASLNHPNIAHVYGLEDADGTKALVMELVEGETLADRIAHGAIPIDEALRIAKQIAEALETAHEHGIIHRDLKPANVKVRPDGRVKVLDFGLAKAMESITTVSPSVSQSPTITTPAATQAGVILGTAGYMSPEQAQRLQVDKRTDIWSFGVVLYEIVTGRRGFSGATTMDVLSNVLRTDPNWSTLPPETPANVRWLLRHCLQKDRGQRLRDIGDARLLIEDVLAQPQGEPGERAPASSLRERLLWTALVMIVAAGAAAVAWTWRGPNTVDEEVRFEINPAPTTDPASLAISPDGQRVAFVGISEGVSRLWVRSLDAITARALPGTENAKSPFWSPDSHSIGFAADDQLKRVDIESGSVRVIASGGALSGAWNQDSTILFDRLPGGGLFRVSADGGVPEEVTHASPQANDHLSPQFLPDHRHFLFYATALHQGFMLASLKGQTRRDAFSTHDGRPTFPPAMCCLYETAPSSRSPSIRFERSWPAPRWQSQNIFSSRKKGSVSPRPQPARSCIGQGHQVHRTNLSGTTGPARRSKPCPGPTLAADSIPLFLPTAVDWQCPSEPRGRAIFGC